MTEVKLRAEKGAAPASERRAFGPDLIRAIAITLVLFAHTFPGQQFRIISLARVYFGYLGVEVFFLLSGYLIGGILLKEMFSHRLETTGDLFRFWKRRWFRTLPNYYLFLLIFLLFAHVSQEPVPSLGRYVWFGQALLWPHPSFYNLAWSLAVEEWFYLTFPLVLLLCAKLPIRRSTALLMAMVPLIIVPVCLRWLMPANSWDADIRKITLLRLDVLMYGVALAYFRQKQQSTWTLALRCWPIGVIGLAAATGYWIITSTASGNLDVTSFVDRVLFVVMISGSLALIMPRVLELPDRRGCVAQLIRKLSLWSYSIYLSHIIVFILVSLVLQGLMPHFFGFNVLVGIVTWIASILISAALYRFYEKPLMDLRDRPLRLLWSRSHKKELT